MAKSKNLAVVDMPADADREIARLERLIAARRALRNAEMAFEGENQRHDRICAVLLKQHEEARAAVMEAMRP